MSEFEIVWAIHPRAATYCGTSECTFLAHSIDAPANLPSLLDVYILFFSRSLSTLLERANAFAEADMLLPKQTSCCQNRSSR